ncbi:DUF4158 domain-containing protein [Streptomyces sp. NPDC051907]|uniref:DUF4158 domain-containing protein n=1 Tax=Streptomyces sp. NPDC051907 TaxID=3155284 RepID=UPI00343D08F0
MTTRAAPALPPGVREVVQPAPSPARLWRHRRRASLRSGRPVVGAPESRQWSAPRLGFAVLMKFLLWRGRFPKLRLDLPHDAVDHVPRQVDLDPGELAAYDFTSSTARRAARLPGQLRAVLPAVQVRRPDAFRPQDAAADSGQAADSRQPFGSPLPIRPSGPAEHPARPDGPTAALSQ